MWSTAASVPGRVARRTVPGARCWGNCWDTSAGTDPMTGRSGDSTTTPTGRGNSSADRSSLSSSSSRASRWRWASGILSVGAQVRSLRTWSVTVGHT